jgi:hypothetical protein
MRTGKEGFGVLAAVVMKRLIFCNPVKFNDVSEEHFASILWFEE